MEDLLPTLVGPAVVAAVVSGAVALASHWSDGRRAMRQRQIETWAEAFRAYVAYKEFSFLVRRRSPVDPAAERVRISNDLSHVQQQLSYYRTWAAAENPRVGAVYEHLLQRARDVAGPAISAGWDRPAVDSDEAMHVKDVDLRGLDDAERLFQAAVHQHLHPVRSWLGDDPGDLRQQIRETVATVRRGAAAGA
jgi:hypothetical protein